MKKFLNQMPMSRIVILSALAACVALDISAESYTPAFFLLGYMGYELLAEFNRQTVDRLLTLNYRQKRLLDAASLLMKGQKDEATKILDEVAKEHENA